MLTAPRVALQYIRPILPSGFASLSGQVPSAWQCDADTSSGGMHYLEHISCFGGDSGVS
jgi:hypothetical protein